MSMSMEGSEMFGKILMFLCFMLGLKPSRERELDKAMDDAAERTRDANAGMRDLRERLQKAQADMHARIDALADTGEDRHVSERPQEKATGV
jgi:hypothetical protein